MDTAVEINAFLDHVKQREQIANDLRLARHIGVDRSTISRIRKNKIGERVSIRLLVAVLTEWRRCEDRAA